MKKIIVIGSSTTGMTAASKIKRVLKDNVEIVGYQKLEYPSLGACGLPYFIAEKFYDPNIMIARTAEQFAEQGIKVHVNHEVLSVDTKNNTVQVKNLTSGETFVDHYDQLIISTGGSAKKLNIPGADAKQVYTLNNIADAISIKSQLEKSKKVIIIGAGFIGLEMCETIKELKKHVTLIESGETIAPRVFDSEIAMLIANELSAEHVDVLCKTSIQKIICDKNNNVIGVELNNGKTLDCDLVLFAMGIAPNTDFLHNTSLKLFTNKAVLVNEHCQTSIANIYSGGDCSATYFRLTKKPFYSAMATTASKMGKVIANNILGNNDYFGGSLGTGIVQIFSGQAARTGLTEQEAKDLKINYKIVIINSDDYTHYIPGAKPLCIKVIYDQDHDTLVGAQLFGYNNAVLRIDALIALIWAQTPIHECGDLDLPYAPQFAKSVDALNLILFKLTNK